MRTIEPFNGFCCLEHCLCEESGGSREAIAHFLALIENGACDRWCGSTGPGKLIMKENDVNEIPQSGPEREAYIISVMQGVKREGKMVVNIHSVLRGEGNWVSVMVPRWDWERFDFRVYEPEVVHYANGYSTGVGEFYESLSDCKEEGGIGRTHYVKRTTGGGRTIPEYEPIPLERGE